MEAQTWQAPGSRKGAWLGWAVPGGADGGTPTPRPVEGAARPRISSEVAQRKAPGAKASQSQVTEQAGAPPHAHGEEPASEAGPQPVASESGQSRPPSGVCRTVWRHHPAGFSPRPVFQRQEAPRSKERPATARC